MSSYGANNSFNSSKANIAKLAMLTFLGVQGVRQLIQVNQQASTKISEDGTVIKGADGKPLAGSESRYGQWSAWLTITMTLVAAFVLYTPVTPSRAALLALFIAALGSGIALIYDYTTNKTQAHAAERNRLMFGILHIILALAVLVYLIMSNM